MSTYFESTEAALEGRGWCLVDATDKVVGRLASEIATVLRGKHKATFTPHTDGGDYVVVINAEKIKFTGNKLTQKVYSHHTGYIGSLKTISADKLLAQKPEEVIKKAVKGMLPKTALGRNQLSKLKVYAGSEHPHAAQQPMSLV